MTSHDPSSSDPTAELKAVFAVVYAPRRNRPRFPENCVTVVDSEDRAIALAQPEKNRFAAQVLGPSRSSEGFRIYYLARWLG